MSEFSAKLTSFYGGTNKVSNLYAYTDARQERLEESFRDFLKVYLGAESDEELEALDEVQQEMVRETPRRFVAFLEEFKGEDTGPIDLDEVLKAGFGFEDESSQMVVQDGIPFRALCAHHLAPFYGEAAIGYLPNKRVVGLSKLPRIVQRCALQRPSLQEEITRNIADGLNEGIDPMGVIVVVRATHTCVSCRGIAASGTTTTTSAVRGVFLTNATARAEFFSLAKIRA